jgi:hypothetical protein
VAELRQWKRDAITRAHRDLASGGRTTTEGLLAAQLEIQREGLAAQAREQEASKLLGLYVPLLNEAKAYVRAIEQYSDAMYRTGYRPDRPTREALRGPIRAATEALDRALQPILLLDTDEERGRLRWEVIRPRTFEPVVDTIENQRLFASVIHYKQLKLQVAIGNLQDNVRRALGTPEHVESESSKEFVAKMLADAETQAAAIEEKLRKEFVALRKQGG